MEKIEQEDETKSGISSDIPKEVEEEEYFHGLLPREDLPCLLDQVGDFVLRVTQPKQGDPLELVISLRVSVDDSPSAIQHVVLYKRKVNGRIEWVAIEPNNFKSVKELIETYISSKRPINPEVKTSILLRPVARKPWEFLHDTITLKEMLGEGQFGEVRAGEALINGKKVPVAVKIAKAIRNSEQLELAKEKVEEMMHEARLMRYFNHENVVKIYGVAVCREPLMIIIEMVNGGCLSDVLECRKGKINELEKVENMSLGSARGLEYIHSQKVIHRDIAARNVLYTGKRVAKISDFGMSRQGDFYQMARGNKKIPLKWTAPESMVTYQYTPKTDVFSFSILLWEIFSDGEEPYKGMTSIEVKRMISCGERMKKPEKCPDFMFQVMEKCWEQSPNNRLTMSQVTNCIENMLDRLYSKQQYGSPAPTDNQPLPDGDIFVSWQDEMEESEPLLKASSGRKKKRKKHHKKRKSHKRTKHQKRASSAKDGDRKDSSQYHHRKSSHSKAT